MSFGAYYQGLKILCEQKSIVLHRTPAFENYIRYVLLSDGIRADVLFESIAQLEKDIVNRLARSAQERTLAALSEQLSLMEKLIDFSLTSQEWDRYRYIRNASTFPWDEERRRPRRAGG